MSNESFVLSEEDEKVLLEIAAELEERHQFLKAMPESFAKKLIKLEPYFSGTEIEIKLGENRIFLSKTYIKALAFNPKRVQDKVMNFLMFAAGKRNTLAISTVRVMDILLHRTEFFSDPDIIPADSIRSVFITQNWLTEKFFHDLLQESGQQNRRNLYNFAKSEVSCVWSAFQFLDILNTSGKAGKIFGVLLDLEKKLAGPEDAEDGPEDN